jgi:hypothetical protein
MNKLYRRLACIVAGFLIVSLPASAAPRYESPTILKASEILAPDIVKGPHHHVDEKVVNDAYLNLYTLHSEYGDVQVTSTAKLMKYIHEVNAVAKMKEIQGTDEFAKGMKNKAGAVVEGAGDLITDPINTVGDTVSGVGKLFSRAGENMFGGARSDSEGSRMGSLLGYAKAKREIGYKLGVDVYSHNEILQKELNDLSSAGGTGTLVMSGLLMAVPGGAGAAVSVAGGTKMMTNLVYWDKSPADLRKMNREKLAAMGVREDVADLFIANGIYTPREQTLLVVSLENMSNTAGRAEYIKLATVTDNIDMAFFRQRQAEMYAAYNAKVQAISSFVAVGSTSAGMAKNGDIVFTVPLDHLLWTKGIAAIIRIATQNVALMKGVNERRLLLSGTASDMARQELAKMGWKVQENADAMLF